MKKLFAVAAFAVFVTGCGPKPPEETSPASAPTASAPVTKPGAAAAPVLKVVNMSPRSTKADKPFNVQVDNGSGISFEVDKPVPPGDVQVMFDGKPLGGVAANGVIVTATIPNEYIAAPGRYPVTLKVAGSTELAAGDFTVE